MDLGNYCLSGMFGDSVRQGSPDFGVSTTAIQFITFDGADVLRDVSLWTKYTVAAIPGSLLFTIGVLPIYQLVAPLIGCKL